MSLQKQYAGYRSFSYLEAGVDYEPFELADEVDRVAPVSYTHLRAHET